MTDRKKKRMAMLDTLATASAAPTAAAMPNNRPLRAARDAVDSHTVWDLNPHAIDDTRIRDRLDPNDIQDLCEAIEANGQTVPILVRRKPGDPDRYLLVYGRRRLEAIRASGKIEKVRALIATMDDDAAVRSQINENMARRDLSFIEKALFARELLDQGFGTQVQVAEVLTVSKSAISMALSVVDALGHDLIRAIGPAHGIGRPRWDALARAVLETGAEPDQLTEIAEEFRHAATMGIVNNDPAYVGKDISVEAFEAVFTAAQPPAPSKAGKSRATADTRSFRPGGRRVGQIKRSGDRLQIDIRDKGFADWLDGQLDTVLTDLHAQFKSRAED